MKATTRLSDGLNSGGTLIDLRMIGLPPLLFLSEEEPFNLTVKKERRTYLR